VIDMPYVNVKVVGKLSYQQKQEIVKGITDLLQKVANKKPETTNVHIEEVDAENWANAGKLLK
jgi:4-oxalocrotonate tautomerase